MVNKQENGSVELKLRVKGGHSVAARELWNTSLGGVFVQLPEPLAFGEEAECEFSLPAEPKNGAARVIHCRAVVVLSSRTGTDKTGGKKGVGLRLMDIRITEMRALAESIGRPFEA